MNDTKLFDYEGVFTFQPEGKSFHGHLKNVSEKGLILELQDLPLTYNPPFFAGLIHGRIFGNPYSCTLLNIRVESTNFSGNPDGMSSISEGKVEYVFLQKKFTNFEEIKFHEMEIYYSNLREWFNKPSIFTTFTDRAEHTEFKKIDPIRGNLNDAFDFQVSFGNLGSFPSESFELSVKQGVSFSIICKNNDELVPVGSFMKIASAIRKFLMFAQNSYVIDEEIFCIDNSKRIRAKLTTNQNHLALPKKFTGRDTFEINFVSDDKLEHILKNWIKKYDEMPDFFKTYFENISNDTLHSIDRFENLFQAILYYFNYKFDENILPKEDYNEFFKNLIDKLESNEKDFVNRFRSMGNQLSIPKILDKVFCQIHFWQENHDARKSVIKNIVDVRTKIQHASSNKNTELVANAQNMTHSMDGILKSLIFQEIDYVKP